jgi:multidrug resistance protein, MATE family
MVAYFNIGCYYFIGVPFGVLLGFKFDFGTYSDLDHVQD